MSTVFLNINNTSIKKKKKKGGRKDPKRGQAKETIVAILDNNGQERSNFYSE